MEVFGGLLQFSDTVQRAILPAPSKHPIVPGRKLLAAGYGTLNIKEPRANASALYGREVEVADVKMPDEVRQHMIAMSGVGETDLEMGVKDLGGPVWDPHTGEVLALIHTTENAGKWKLNMAMAVHVNRNWIDETRQDMHQDY